jgi:hypothetical protein
MNFAKKSSTGGINAAAINLPVLSERAQERSISILQKRFGYTREKAKSELSKHYSKARLG